MFSKFSEEARKVLVNAKKEMISLKHTYVGSEHFILSLLSMPNSIRNLLNSMDINYDNYKKKVIELIGEGESCGEYFVYSSLLKKIIDNAIINSKDKGLKEVTLDMLFLSMLDLGEGSALRVLLSYGINIDDLYEEVTKNYTVKKKKNNLLVYEYGVCLNKMVEDGELDPVIGREEETDRIIEILCRRNKNNPLLIGEAGVGKTAIVENLARRIFLGEVPLKLLDKKIISISMANLVSGTKYRGEFEERVTKLIKEVEDDSNIIIFFDEVHTLVGAGGAEGAIDASNILKPALARGKISIIGATTIYEYKKSIENDKALSRRFQTITVLEPDFDKTFSILSRIKPIYEKYHNVEISDNILKLIIKLTSKYMYNRKEPDRSIDILDESLSKASIMEDEISKKNTYYKGLLNTIRTLKNNAIVDKKFDEALYLREEELKLETCINKLSLKKSKSTMKKVVTEDIVADVIESKVRVPVFELCNNDSIFSNLERKLKDAVYGQDDVINKVVNYSKTMYSSIKLKERPISFLFTGPIGSGKSYLSTLYGESIFGKDNIIRIDGSMYMESHTISNIIGSPLGYKDSDSKKTVLDEIKDKPYSLVLIDNIDKMHNDVLNVIIEILKEGKIKDAYGNLLKFSGNTIIMTMDIDNDNSIGFNEKKGNIDLKKYIDIRLINSVNMVLSFNKLSINDIKNIIKNKLSFIEREHNIVLNNKDILEEKVLEDSDYEEVLSSKIDTIIESNISNYIINKS